MGASFLISAAARRAANLPARPKAVRRGGALLCAALFAAAPVLVGAFEDHALNVRMDLRAPVSLSATTVTVSASGDSAEDVRVELTPTFRDQSRLDGLDYRLVATVEPLESSGATDPSPAAVLTRDPGESDDSADSVEGASLGTRPEDLSDVWVVSVQAAPARPSPESAAGASADAAPGASVGATPTPSLDDSAAASVPVPSAGATELGGWLVRLSVEIIGYRAAEVTP